MATGKVPNDLPPPIDLDGSPERLLDNWLSFLRMCVWIYTNTPRNADRSEGGVKKKTQQKQIKLGPRDVEIRVRSMRFTPRGVENK